MAQNQIDYTLDPRNVLAGLREIDALQRKVAAGVTVSAKEWETAYGNTSRIVGQFFSRSEQNQERYIKGLERAGVAAGKSGIEKLIALRDRDIKATEGQIKANEKAIRITKAYQDQIDALNKSQNGNSNASAVQALRGVRDLFEGRTAYGEVMIGKALAGAGGSIAIIGGITAALGAAAVASFKAAEAIGEYGMQVRNVQERTGFTTKEVAQFGFAAKLSGEDVSIFERAMRGTTQAIEDQSAAGDKARDWLGKFGVDIRAVREGLVPTSVVMQQIGEGFKNLPAGIQRTKAELDLLKRIGIEAAPVFVELTERLERARQIKLGFSESDVAGFADVHKQLTEIGARYEQFKLELQSGFSIPIRIVLDIVKGGPAADFVGGMFSRMTQHPFLTAAGVLAGPASTLGAYAYASRLSKYSNLTYKGPQSAATPVSDPAAVAAAQRKAESDALDDAAVRSYQSSLGPEYRLHKAERELSKLGEVDKYSTREKVAARQGIEHDIEVAKADVKAAEQQKSVVEHLRKSKAEAAESALYPYGRLRADQKLIEFSGLPTTTPAQVEAMRATLQPELVTEVRKNLRNAGLWAPTFGIGIDGRLAVTSDYGGKFIGHDARQIVAEKDHGASAEAVAKIREFELALKQSGADLREQTTAMREIQAETRRNEESAGIAGVTLRRTGAADTIANRLEAERQIAQIKMNAANEEWETAKSIAASKVDQEDALEALRIKHEGEVAAVQQQFAQEQANELRRQTDEIKNSAQGLLHTLFTSPGQFSKSLGTTLRDATLKPIENGLSEQLARTLHPMIFGADGKGGISGALGGMFGGSKLAPIGTASDPVNVMVVGGGWNISGGAANTPFWGAGNFGGPVGIGTGNGIGTGGDGGWFGGGTNSPGGTPGFAPGSIGLGGGGNGSGTAGGWGGLLGGLKGNIDWGGITRGDTGTAGPDDGSGTPGKDGGSGITGVNGMFGTLLAAGGLALAKNGLLGNSRGTASGALQGALGGAMVGFKFGGPLGAAIGGAIGLGIGVGEILAGVESPRHEAIRLVKQRYHIDISNSMADQIVALAKQSYGGTISIAVSSPEVRNMLGLYAAGTGQAGAFPQSASSPHGASFVESGGRLAQQSVYQYGNAYAYQSSVPIYGGGNPGVLPGGGGGGQQISLNISGSDAASFMTGQFVTPSFVAQQSAAAARASNGRVQQAMILSQPGSIVS